MLLLEQTINKLLFCSREYWGKICNNCFLMHVEQVGYSEKIANVWATVAEESSRYARESS